MMSNKNSLDAKCPRTNAYGVAGPGGDVRKYVTTAGASFIICTATSNRSERRMTICGFYEAQILARIRVQVRVSETPNHAVLYAGNHFFVCTCRILPHTSYYPIDYHIHRIILDTVNICFVLLYIFEATFTTPVGPLGPLGPISTLTP